MSRWKWQKAMREQVVTQGIELYESGKLAQVNLSEALTALLERDHDLLRAYSRERPLTPCVHFDHTSISNRRHFTQLGLTASACYQQAAHTQSELKYVNVGIGQFKDDGAGLCKVLQVGMEHGAAAQIEKILTEKKVGQYAVDLKITLDLAAARGFRQCRGKSACVCGCQGREQLQSVPDLACLPCDDSVEA